MFSDPAPARRAAFRAPRGTRSHLASVESGAPDPVTSPVVAGSVQYPKPEAAPLARGTRANGGGLMCDPGCAATASHSGPCLRVVAAVPSLRLVQP